VREKANEAMETWRQLVGVLLTRVRGKEAMETRRLSSGLAPGI